jgi:biopolymer transport protein ExbD
MAFKPDSGSDREAMSEINVTPLVDVMLVLLVVFIVTAPLLTQAVRVDLPQTQKTDTPPEKHFVTLEIDPKGTIILKDQEQKDLFTAQAQDLSDKESAELTASGQQLQQHLKTLIAADPELTVQFSADKNVIYDNVSKTIAVVHQAGIGKLAFISVQN